MHYRDICNGEFHAILETMPAHNTKVISSVPTRLNVVFAVLQFLYVYAYSVVYSS